MLYIVSNVLLGDSMYMNIIWNLYTNLDGTSLTSLVMYCLTYGATITPMIYRGPRLFIQSNEQFLSF